MSITKRQRAKLLRLIADYGGAVAAAAVVSSDLDSGDAALAPIANRLERAVTTRERRIRAYLVELTEPERAPNKSGLARM